MPNCLSWAESDYESKVKQHTGKLLSEALIFASTNPQYDDRFTAVGRYKNLGVPVVIRWA